MTEIGVAYVNIVPKTDEFSSTVAEASNEAGSAGGKAAGGSISEALNSTLGDLFGTGGEMGSSLSGGMESYLGGAGKLAIGAAVAAIGVAALAELEKIGEEIDAMTDTIIVGTGASGEQLEEMRQIAMGMSQDVAISFADSGDIVQDFSTRLGLSGEELESVATHAAQLDHIVGGINYDRMATMFNVWGVGADEMNAKMDYMFGVSQNTGIGFDQLTSIMQSSGPTLQALGFSFEQSANMAGLLDKAGIDSSSTMSRLSKALVELSEPGESAQDAFRRTVDEMQGFIDAGDTASALDIATNVFGTRGAAQFIAALQTGAFSMEELSDAALGASGNISDTYEVTESWPEQWQRIQSGIASALEPIATGVFSTIGTILEGIGDALHFIWEKSEPLRETIGGIADGLAQRLGPVVETVTPFFQGLGDILGGVVQVAFEGIATAVQTVADIISWVWDNILKPFADWCAETFGPIIDAVGGFFEQAGATMSTSMDMASQAVIDSSSYMYGNLDANADKWVQQSDGTWKYVANTMSNSMDSAEASVESSANDITTAMEFDGVSETAGAEFSEAGANMEEPIESAASEIENTPSDVTNAFWGLGGKITDAIGSIHFPSPHVEKYEVFRFGDKDISVPKIVWYAQGGFVDGTTLIGAGEAGPEMILPAQGGLMDMFSDAIAEKVNGGNNVTVYLNYDASEDANELASDIAHALSRKLALEGAA